MTRYAATADAAMVLGSLLFSAVAVAIASAIIFRGVAL